MNDLARTEVPRPLHSNGEVGQELQLVGGEELCTAGPAACRASQQSRNSDESLKRLRALRDFHKQRGNPAKAAGVEAAIRILRECL